MGLLDDYQVDLNDAPDAPSYDVADDFYEFVVGDMFIREGTTNYPDTRWFVIDFALGEEGKSKQEWFQLPEDPDNPTDKELQTYGRLKTRLKDLGAGPDELKDIDPEFFVGLSGSLEVYTFTNKKTGVLYQNIRNVVLEGAEEEVAEEAPAEEAAPTKAAPVKRAAPAAAARKEAAAPAKAAEKGAVRNPFAKK